MLITAAILGILALPLLIVGLRGRRVDDHPVCRKCRFDLSGVYPARTVCPECGSEQTEHPPRIGNRRKRWRVVLVGCTAIVVAVSLTGLSVWRSVDEKGWVRFAPTFMLKGQVVSSDAPKVTMAADELLRRLDEEALNTSVLNSAVNAVLERQADADVTWLVEWGQFVEDARLREAVSDEQWGRYAEGIFCNARLVPRSPVRVGDAVPYTIILDARCSNRAPFGVIFRIGPSAVNGQLAEIVVQREREDPWLTVTPGSQSHMRGFVSFTLPPELGVSIHHNDPLQPFMWRLEWAKVKTEGPGTVETQFQAFLFENPNHPMQFNGIFDLAPDQAIATRTFDASGDFVAVDEGSSTVEFVTDPALAPLLSSKNTTVYRRPNEQWDCHGNIAITPPLTVDLAFDVFWQAGEREWFVGTIKHKATSTNTSRRGWFSHWRRVEGFDPVEYPMVNVILRPSSDAARRTPGITRIWGREIIFKDVPIEWPGAPDLP